jgi:hypothetical protein
MVLDGSDNNLGGRRASGYPIEDATSRSNSPRSSISRSTINAIAGIMFVCGRIFWELNHALEFSQSRAKPNGIKMGLPSGM